MTVKPVAITNEEIPIYEQEENLAKLYERRQDQYDLLLEKLETVKKNPWVMEEAKANLALEICEFLLKEVQFRKLV